MKRGVLLEKLTWTEAEQCLDHDSIVVIPLGSALKEHGYHLPLNTDWVMAEYLKHQVLAIESVVVLPTVNHHYYPSFVEYPGSISLAFGTACTLIVDMVNSLHRFGPAKFYVLNTGISTVKPLQNCSEIVAREGVLLTYSNWSSHLSVLESRISEQEGGSHADEIETSIMLYIAPHLVDMTKAVKDFNPDQGPLTRRPDGTGTYSPSGVWGDATLATHEKGRLVTEALVDGIRKDIADLKATSLPPRGSRSV